jgi:hypothetical protein
MTSFAKKPLCPSSATISAYTKGTLSFLLHHSVAEHLARCEFCSVESSLWRAYPAQGMSSEAHVAAEAGVPPMPLALRLLAERTLYEMQPAVAPAAASRAA